MKLVDAKRNDDAAKFNSKAAKILVVLAVTLIVVQLLI